MVCRARGGESVEENLFRSIPRVDELLDRGELKASALSQTLLRESVREELDALRSEVRGGRSSLPETDELCARILARAEEKQMPSLRTVINATGVTLHTNLGRACLSERAANAAAEAAYAYSTLEYDAVRGCRGSRHSHVESLLCRLTGAEAAMAVNNNAAAVLLILTALASGGEVIVSRGELVEIGGSFRIPEIVTQCGCTLREVGATNKTHLRDYEAAVSEQTRAILKVHTSNYRIVGFTESVPREALAALARERGLPLIEDLGSGALVELEQYGIHGEPTVQRSLRAGVDVASFSGDKLLGGPQAGLIVGRKEYIERLKKHPLARALRLQQALAGAGVASQLVKTGDAVGGGSAPAQELPGWAVALDPGKHSVDELEERLRMRAKPIVARIHRGQYLLCVRTIDEKDFAELAATAAEALR